MEKVSVQAPDGPPAVGGYSQALVVKQASRLLYVSGQVPVATDGTVPRGFEDQARLVWRNVERQLIAGGMTLDNVVKHTTYLASRAYRDANSAVRREVLGSRSPALTVVIAEIYDEAWLLEIEAIAAD